MTPKDEIEEEIDVQAALARLRERGSGLAPVLAASGGDPVYLVGGVVRDALLGIGSPDLDLVVEGDAVALAARLGEGGAESRFGTAKVELPGGEVDLVSARRESYARPGALPEVEPAGLREDLARRDFTVNAMAVPLPGAEELIDPHGGLADLRSGLLRALHPRSFEDDPTRALRAARYAARLGLGLEAGTAELLSKADLSTVSADRVDGELARFALERDPAAGARLAAEWGLIEAPGDALELIGPAFEVLERPWWSGSCSRRELLLTLLGGLPEPSRRLTAQRPARPSEAVEAAAGIRGADLVIARASGAGWLDDYVSRWRDVSLEIAGGDLIEAGIEPGPRLGRGLRAALAAKLDGRAAGREEELEAALEEASKP